MTIIEALQELLSCKAVNGNTASHAILEENDPLAKLQKITLSELKPGMLVLHIDNGRKVLYEQAKKQKIAAVCMSPLFRTDGIREHNCGCDAVVVRIPNANKPDCELIYIELKSDAPSGFAGQFRSTWCFFRYIQTLLKVLWEVEMSITKERYVVFHTDTQNSRPSLGKQPPRFSPKGANSPYEPEKYIVKNLDTIHCNQLF